MAPLNHDYFVVSRLALIQVGESLGASWDHRHEVEPELRFEVLVPWLFALFYEREKIVWSTGLEVKVKPHTKKPVCARHPGNGEVSMVQFILVRQPINFAKLNVKEFFRNCA